jgi:hypothetical protein
MVYFPSFILLSIHILPALLHKACFSVYNVCFIFYYRFKIRLDLGFDSIDHRIDMIV